MGVSSVDGLDRAVLNRANAAPAPQLRTANAASKPKEEQVQPADLPARTKVTAKVEKAPAPEVTPKSLTRISVDKESNRIVTQIIGENNEVIRQIPPKEVLEFSAKFKKLQGLLFDELA